MEKPPYRVPLMAEIERVPPNGLTVASTFSGCGGSCLGFRMAGYRTVYASEFVAAAADTYRANHPGVPLDARDIRDVTGDSVRELSGCDAFDVLEGSPPCASFSTAGRRSAHWGDIKSYSDTRQRTDDLFFEFARLLGELRPRAFVAENVAGLVRGVAKGYFKLIHAALVAQGYRVEARLLDAQWLGVPQTRSRVIFVGVRDDLGVGPRFPDPLPYRYTIRDAVPWVGGMTAVGHGYFHGGDRSADRPAPTVSAGPGSAAYNGHAVRIEHDSMGNGANTRYMIVSEVEVGAGGTYGTEAWRGVDEPVGTIGASPSTGNGRSPSGVIRTRGPDPGASMEGYAVGEEWDRLDPGEKSDRYLSLVRADADRPSPTVTAVGGSGSIASVAHPFEKRKFTIEELRRLCGFPDDFVLTGSYAQQWERLGRAVPPPMMRAVAASLAEVIG